MKERAKQLIEEIKKKHEELYKDHNIYIEDISSRKYFCNYDYTPDDEEYVVDIL